MTKLHYKTTELLLVSFGINSIRLRHKKVFTKWTLSTDKLADV